MHSFRLERRGWVYSDDLRKCAVINTLGQLNARAVHDLDAKLETAR